MKDMTWRLCLVCIFAILCTARSVDACACADLGSLADEYHKSSAVFIGRRVAIVKYRREYIRVTRSKRWSQLSRWSNAGRDRHFGVYES